MTIYITSLDGAQANLRRLTPAKLVARNSVLNLAGELWTFLVVLVAMPIAIRELGKDAFGIFSLAWVVLGYISLLDIGVSRAATKFISERLAKEEHRSAEDVSRTALTANFVLGLLGGLFLLPFIPALTDRVFKIPIDLRPDAVTAFYGLALAVPVILVQAALRAVLSSLQKFGWISLMNASTVTVQWASVCALAIRGFRVGTVVLVAVIVRVVGTAGYAAVLFAVNRRLVGFSTKQVREISSLLRYGGWVSISQFIAPILIYLDRILIASLVSIGAMTIYVIPYEIITRLRVIPASLGATLFPSFSERSGIEQDSQLADFYSGALRYLMLVLVPCFVFLVLLGRDILSIWVGAEYARQGTIVLQIIGSGALLNSLAFVPYAALQALGRPDLPAKLHVAEVPLYMGLSFLLIPKWGVTGAALAVAARLVVDAGALFWAADRYVYCAMRYDGLPKMLALNVGLAFLLECGRFLWISSIARLAAGVLAVLIYFVAIWFVALDRQDKPALLRALRLTNETAP